MSEVKPEVGKWALWINSWGSAQSGVIVSVKTKTFEYGTANYKGNYSRNPISDIIAVCETEEEASRRVEMSDQCRKPFNDLIQDLTWQKKEIEHNRTLAIMSALKGEVA